MPDTHAAAPPGRFHVRAEHMLAWLAAAVDPGGLPFQESYGFDNTFRPDGDDLHDRIQILVNQAQNDGVIAVPGHHLELWQVGDHGFLLTLDPPRGPRLCSQHLGIADLMPDKTAGSVAAFAVLDATARAANQLLDERDHGAGRTITPTVLSCAADPRRIRDWLAGPSTDARLATGSVADVWDFGATFTTDPGHAVHLVEQAQQAGVFGIPGHHIALLHVPSDEHPDQDGFLVTIDTPTGQRLCSDWLRLDDIIAPDLAGRAAAIDCLTTLATTVDTVLTPTPPVAGPNEPAAPRSRTAGAFPQPGTTAATNPPPLPAPGPAVVGPAPSTRHR